MDSKRLILGITLSLALFSAWFIFMTWVNAKWPEKKPPAADATSTAVAPAAQQANQVTPSPTTTAAPTTGQTVLNASQAMELQVVSEPRPNQPASVDLGSAALKDPNYALLMKTTALGAGVDGVVLNNYLRTVDKKDKDPYVFQHAPTKLFEQYGHPLAMRSITVKGVLPDDPFKALTVGDLARRTWTLEHHDAERATYSLTLGLGGQPVLKILKTFRVYSRTSTDHSGDGLEVVLEYVFDNLAGRPLTVSMSYLGPAIPPRELDSGPDQRVMVGYLDGPGIAVDNHYVEEFSGDEQTLEMAVNDEKLPAWWAGASSVYFQAIVMPPLMVDRKTTSSASVKGIGLDPDHSTGQPLALTFDTADMQVGAGDLLRFPLMVYFGPKHREILNKPFYATLPRDYDETLVVRAGPCAMCTFDWLINVLVAMLGWFHAVTKDWGLAIICLVILVRLALHPITKRSQVSMMKMGKMAPEMKRLQEKYKDDKEALQRAMWEFQKQQGMTPILGCLPMFLQMPIWIALWSALNTTFELRHSSFLWGLTWIDDLAKPDRLIPFPEGYRFTIPLIGVVFDAINVLPILLAVVFYLQQKFMPKPPTMTPEQAQQQKIMQWMMVFLFPLFLYGQPSGLNLYILTSTAIGIWESKRIRKHIQEKEEAEKAGVVIVDAEPPSAGGGGKGRKKEPLTVNGLTSKAPAAPQGWLARKIADIQKKAEAMQREADRRSRRDKA